MFALDRLLWYVFAATRGGPTRIRIADALLERARNANALASLLHLDYKTVEYNLRVLSKHALVKCEQPGAYGALHAASKNLLAARADFEEIRAAMLRSKVGLDMGKRTSSANAGDVVK